jgi:NADH dehydrogenase
MAGQIAELSHRSLQRNFRHFDPASARVVLLDAGDALIPAFGKRLSGKALSGLQKLGVEVHLHTMVTNVDADGVDAKHADGGSMRVDAQTKIWAAGVEASGLGKLLRDQSGAETDHTGRVKVNDDLTLPGHPEVFVVGDLINLKKLPGVAEVAMQGGLHAARAIKHRVESSDPNAPAKDFHYRDLGDMATISRFQAVAKFGPFRVAGFLGWLMWLFVHLAFLTGFKNRVATVFNWFIAFIGRGRPQRTITRQQVLARTVLQQQQHRE